MIDPNMTIDELRAEVKRQAKTANQRIYRAKKEGGLVAAAPAYRPFFREDGPEKLFSVTGKTTAAQLRAELKRIHMFMDDKTSTVTGARDWIRNTEKLTGADFGNDPEASRKYWEGYHKYMESNVYDALGSPRAGNQLIELYTKLWNAGAADQWEQIQQTLADYIDQGADTDRALDYALEDIEQTMEQQRLAEEYAREQAEYEAEYRARERRERLEAARRGRRDRRKTAQVRRARRGQRHRRR